ncbi:MAG: T9SS type A sorting domain-containing protein [Saprospiraceae bacterium]|nr:T9SS type A sorting domain-containing protein [Saprospiraceae bacterium]MDW8484986.1 T9SS type A sorting domain-containing protein [Saprospiraceae bacterium]
MKRLFLFLVWLFAQALWAQQQPKQYVLIEHFTNSRCPICASRNPAFYDLIRQYAKDIHHLAIHPSVPYSTCVFYQANPPHNTARANFYGINGTPRVVLNGIPVPAGNPLLPAATLQAALGKTSPVAIEVKEAGTAPTKTAQIIVRTFGNTPPGTYKLWVAVAEKTVNYNAPNGENKHYDVLRAFLTNPDGNDISLPPPGGSVSFNFSYTHTQPNGWTSHYDSLYVLAFIQEINTKAVLNSGTRFDPVFTEVSAPSASAHSVLCFPNPTADQTYVALSGEYVRSVEVCSSNGQCFAVEYTLEAGDRLRLSLSSFPPGLYYIRLTTDLGAYTGRIIRQ